MYALSVYFLSAFTGPDSAAHLQITVSNFRGSDGSFLVALLTMNTFFLIKQWPQINRPGV